MGGGDRDGLPTLQRIVAQFDRGELPPVPVAVLTGCGVVPLQPTRCFAAYFFAHGRRCEHSESD